MEKGRRENGITSDGSKDATARGGPNGGDSRLFLSFSIRRRRDFVQPRRRATSRNRNGVANRRRPGRTKTFEKKRKRSVYLRTSRKFENQKDGASWLAERTSGASKAGARANRLENGASD